MPEYKPYTLKYLEETLRQIEAAIYTTVAPLEIEAWRTPEPIPFDARTTGEHITPRIGESWGGLFDCAWFHFTGHVPERDGDRPLVLLLDVSGEMCVFDEAGAPVRGLTSMASSYDFSLGRPGKRVLPLASPTRRGDAIEVWADAGCNDLFGNLQDGGAVKLAEVATVDEAVRALYYDFEVLLDFLKTLPVESPRYQQVLTGLTDAVHLLYGGIPQNARQARAVLAPLLARRNGDAALKVSAVGHAHMDLAWLWPIRETIRKGARTFATGLANIEKYPDYVFGASQPQYFAWMKEYYPALWDRIVAAVAAGRIDVQGCMWVEADTNVSGGEALVRQILYGKRFWRSEFGLDVKYLWLPDVFGYSGSLPGILARAGVPYFSTQKLSWSLVNTFPHQSFHWHGIDGSEVLAHMLPEETYNSPAAPRSVRMIERNYKDSGVSSRALMVFGIGDGGGGPGEEHLERLARIKNLEGLSPVKQETVADFLEKWQVDAARFATWVGELYLERHEGTLTTKARNKRYNRKMELALRDMEWSCVLAGMLAGAAYPAARLEALWREMLLYQFHDILPGSTIKRVYDESVARYEVMLAEAEACIAENDLAIAAQADTAGMAQPVVVHQLAVVAARRVGEGGRRLDSGGCARDGLRRAGCGGREPDAGRRRGSGDRRRHRRRQDRERPAARPVRRGWRDRLDLRQTRSTAKCSSRAQPPTGWPSTPTWATPGTSRWITPSKPRARWNWSVGGARRRPAGDHGADLPARPLRGDAGDHPDGGQRAARFRHAHPLARDPNPCCGRASRWPSTPTRRPTRSSSAICAGPRIATRRGIWRAMRRPRTAGPISRSATTAWRC